MADTKREIERKYEGPAAEGGAEMPDLSGVPGVAGIVDKGVAELDATYYDTPDQRLAAASLTLRRRTGGDDAGWHLKLPVSEGVRDEIRAPLSDTVPRALAGLVRSRVRDAELVPLVRLRSARDVRHLVDDSGALLAEVSLDRVRADRIGAGEGTAAWTEIEVELADDGDPAFLDKVEKKLRKAGLRRSAASSKLAKALGETGKRAGKRADKPAPEKEPADAGDHVLAYLRAQYDAIVELDPAVRRDLPDSVHSMRVATRRMRSTFRSYGKVLDRAVTDPIGDELKWLAGELGVGRDQEVLTERLTESLGRLPRTLLSGPVRTRLRTWANARRGGSRRRLIAVLDGKRYLTLLTALEALVADPPLLEAAGGDPAKVIAKAVRKDFGKVSDLVEQALDQPPGTDRDHAMHEARKKAKRTRYAAEAAAPALGAPAAGLVKSMKSLQSLLGDHQDSVMARETLRELAALAHTAGESSFTYGVLYGREEQRAAAVEAALPEAWEKIEAQTAV
ncbi:CYTH and CHAD domain-containing protein [Streptomyces triticiradicis]|uniref:CYTH and CHAD domain-containing protein n=1 Tax=Streptomyces triticiradicis TaxID=2651189 RepID=A0A7J5DBD2_9ACTN|nr:CYTH and CHAD domain-containing protein [Streptomyces triticiradicis]KAB1986122.1 CYTH and CHAD domain-containing protein [Streptomyces triticiradicis]